MTSATLELARELISRPSITPDDAGCQQLLIERLQAIGFRCESLPFGEVSNFWARRGDSGPLLAFAGRGAADMKSSIAAMITACERFVDQQPDHSGSIALLITSDEEGVAVDGTVRVIDVLEARGEKIDWALVGEPSSQDRVGDVCKNGRRGSIGAHLVIHGVQGHVAYPHKVDNPIHRAMPALHELASHEWDRGNQFFPPTSLQISNLNAGTGAHNVVPGHAEINFNLRYSTEIDAAQIMDTTRAILDKHELNYDIDWKISGYPFLTPAGELVEAASAAIREHTGIETQLLTTGGTSDGRFIAPTGAQVLELGPVNESIHKIDEHVDVAQLETLSAIYQGILEKLLGR